MVVVVLGGGGLAGVVRRPRRMKGRLNEVVCL